MASPKGKNSENSSSSRSMLSKAPLEKNRVIFELVERSSDPTRPFRPLHIISSVDNIYDPKTGTERTIRYIPGVSSIFVDEQHIDPAFMNVGLIEFHRGRCVVPKTEASLLAFLNATNQNQTNENRKKNRMPIFKELDIMQEASSDFERSTIKRRAVEAAWYDVDNNIDAMYFYARVLGIQTSKLEEKMIINKYISAAESNPELFLKHHKSPRNEHKYFVMTALDKGLISSKHIAGQIVWSDTKGIITILPAGKNEVDYTTDFMIDKDNEETYLLLKEKVLSL